MRLVRIPRVMRLTRHGQGRGCQERPRRGPFRGRNSFVLRSLPMLRYPLGSVVFLLGLLIFNPLAPQVLMAQTQGPQHVPVPVPPPTKRPSSAKKDRSAFPLVPAFKDIAKEVGLT